jgi:predicted PurR-regulated permease PerM
MSAARGRRSVCKGPRTIVRAVSALVSSDGARWFVRGAALAAGALLVIGLVGLAVGAATVLAMTFVALLLAAALDPLADRLRERLPTGRAGTILVIYGAVFMALTVFAALALPVIAREADRVLIQLPATLGEFRAWADDLEPEVISTAAVALLEVAGRFLASIETPTVDDIVEVGSAAAGLVAAAVTILALAFFWLLERPRLQRYALAFVGERHRGGLRDSWNAIEARLGQWVRGQLILMAAVGVASGIAYTVLGVPSPLLLAVIAGVAEIVPIIGPLVGVVPAVLVAATVSPELAVLVGLVGIAIQVIEGMVLVPIVLRRTMGLSPMLTFLSVLIGAAVGGIIGALLAVPVAATLEIVLERFQEREEPVVADPAAVMGEAPEESEPPVPPEPRVLPSGSRDGSARVRRRMGASPQPAVGTVGAGTQPTRKGQRP